MIQEYRQLAAEIVLELCQTDENRLQVVEFDAIKSLLGMVQNCRW